tara:strand:- start:3548 stop:4327 length:780 start_codon:yes stop_codon:yes gene_type:complete
METKENKAPAKAVVKETKKNTWEIKDRLYTLSTPNKPLSYRIQSKGMLWFDEQKGEQRELRYAVNMPSPFVDEQKGKARLSQIVFEDGILMVPKQKTNLQKLLSLYHPGLNKTYVEENKAEAAAADVDYINVEIDALIAARSVDIDKAEAVLRVEIGSEINTMSSKEIKRDLLLMAKRNPYMFLELLEDENVELRNVAIKAQENGIIVMSQDQRTFNWGSNGRKLMTIPFDDNPYSAIAAWFKTDEGVEVYKTITKKLK